MAERDDNALGSPMLSFGIITDTHVRSPEGDQSSPYPVNDKANARARYACELLAAQNPRFVIHLGDMVHPLPAMASYDPACKEAVDLFEPLKPNLHYVAGNHDVGDKPMPGSPAAIVNADAMAKYSEWFGPHWYSFDVDDLRIIVINSSLLNTASKAEQEQNSWLDGVLADSHSHRTILFSHYPLFIHDASEDEHYDNIAEPGRTALLERISKYAVDMVFSGHVHHFFFNQIGCTQFFTLPSTSFTRQDYSDLFKAGPAAEFGRDDAAKFAVTMIDVYPNRCELRIIETGGIEHEQASSVHTPPATPLPSRKHITVSMRHPWHESIDLPYNGPMEEFSRKRARNDYTLLRLMQMGIKQLRVPLQDFLEKKSRRRIEEAASLDFRFTIVCLQNGWGQLPAGSDDIYRCIDAVEFILPNDKEHWLLPDQTQTLPIPIYLGFAATGAHNSNASKPFAHTVSSGFPLDQLESVCDWLDKTQSPHSSAGIVVQIPWESSLDTSFTSILKALNNYPGKIVANLKIAKSNPALENLDENQIIDRICQAMDLCDSNDRVELQLDTFMSLDRGYSPRTGLVDRLTNLTSVGNRLADYQ